MGGSLPRRYGDALAQLEATRGSAAGGLRGANYFQAFARGTEAVWWTLSPGGRFGVYKGGRLGWGGVRGRACLSVYLLLVRGLVRALGAMN